MKKNLIIFLLIVITCILGINKIEARECKYNYNGNEITLTFTKKQDSNDFTTSFYVEKVSGYNEIFNFVDGSLITADDQCLNALTVCKLTARELPIGTTIIAESVADSLVGLATLGWPGAIAGGLTGIVTGIVDSENSKEVYLGIFGSSLDSLTIDDAYAKDFNLYDDNFWSTNFWTGRGVSCEVAEYSGEKIDKSKRVSYCDKFVQLYSDVANSYKDFEKCGKVTGNNSEKAKVARCKSKAITDVNKNTDILKNTCDSILQNQSLSVEDGCVSSCLQASKSIQVLKERYIGLENFNNDCSISDRLIIWINNILKWVKYIVPVAVMVLGIIDFIKAISAGKDDEMKKAQGNFIKRLIAAALIFIIPLIIGFVLDKMGFTEYINGCGIMDI